MTRVAITVLTFGALAVALVLGIAWFVDSDADSRWEPAVNTLALLAGITGIFAERWAAQRERREQSVDSIDLELARNADLLESFRTDTGTGRRVYPRLIQSAVDSAFASGALNPRRDTELIELLHRWRAAVGSVNRRLELTELLMFTNASAEEVDQFDRALHGFMQGIRSELTAVRDYLGAIRSEPSKRITSPFR